jgi:hypothetical protein
MRHSRWNANLWENTMKASRLKCELNQMWEVPLARKADDFRLRRVISPNPPPFRASPPQSRIFPLEPVGSLDVLVEPRHRSTLCHLRDSHARTGEAACCGRVAKRMWSISASRILTLRKLDFGGGKIAL